LAPFPLESPSAPKLTQPRLPAATTTTTPCTYCVSRNKACTYTTPAKGPPLTLAAALETRVKATEALLRQLSLTTKTDLLKLIDAAEPEREAALTVAASRLRDAHNGADKGKGKDKEGEPAGARDHREGSLGSSGGTHTPHRSTSIGTSYGSPAGTEEAEEEGEIVVDTVSLYDAGGEWRVREVGFDS